MNTSRKLLLLAVVAVTGYGALIALQGRTDGQGAQPFEFAESIDATMFGMRLDDTPVSGHPTSAAAHASIDADEVPGTASNGSAEGALESLRTGCQGWLRKLGYSDSEESLSTR